MELLIPGIILVALMVYVSTKIKKSAASAFERETFENEEFKITKPEGFLNPINEKSVFLYEAYTKDFGKNDADEIRQATVNISSISNTNIENVIESIKNSGENVRSKNFAERADSGRQICLLETEKTNAAIDLEIFYKLIEDSRRKKVYQLRITVLDAYRNDYSDKIEEMLESFVLK